jgi:hypothetical protein
MDAKRRSSRERVVGPGWAGPLPPSPCRDPPARAAGRMRRHQLGDEAAHAARERKPPMQLARPHGLDTLGIVQRGRAGRAAQPMAATVSAAPAAAVPLTLSPSSAAPRLNVKMGVSSWKSAPCPAVTRPNA